MDENLFNGLIFDTPVKKQSFFMQICLIKYQIIAQILLKHEK